jgi:hypothetical protein
VEAGVSKCGDLVTRIGSHAHHQVVRVRWDDGWVKDRDRLTSLGLEKTITGAYLRLGSVRLWL